MMSGTYASYTCGAKGDDGFEEYREMDECHECGTEAGPWSKLTFEDHEEGRIYPICRTCADEVAALEEEE